MPPCRWIALFTPPPHFFKCFNFWGRSKSHQKSDLYQTLPKSQNSNPWVPKARFWNHFGSAAPAAVCVNQTEPNAPSLNPSPAGLEMDLRDSGARYIGLTFRPPFFAMIFGCPFSDIFQTIDDFWLPFWLHFAYVFDQFRTPFSDPVSASISHWFVSISEPWILENVDFHKTTQPELCK